MSKIKVVHYINQFFAQIGGEEKADYPAELRVGEIVGPGMALMQQFKDEAEIVATIVCGDSYFNENLDKAKADILEMVKSQNPDIFIAGPAFNAGRYGVACGTICDAVQEELGIPAVTGMYVENPGADMFKNKVYTVSTKNSAAGMRDAIGKLAPLAMKLAKGEKIGASCQEGYMPNGVRVNFFEKERGSKRAVKMLLKKLADKPFETEYPMPSFDRVDPQPAIKDLSKATIALCTSGGIVPKGNPDHIESSNASHYGEYDITGVMDLTEDTYEMFNKKGYNGKERIDYLVGKYGAIVAPSFVAMKNALEGFAEDYREDGSAFRLQQSFWTADSVDEFNKQYALSIGMYDNTYSVEDMMEVLKSYTPETNFEKFRKFTEK